MSRVRDESGFTITELLVGVLITLLVFGCVMTALETFQRGSSYDQARNEAQDNARTTIDRLSRELRNVASPSAGSAGALEQAGAYDLVFQTVDASQAPTGTQNATNQMRVRYCLDTTNPNSEILWRQTQRWTTASPPAIPATSTCPSSAWSNQYRAAVNVTNNVAGQTRGLFSYGPAAATSTSQMNAVAVDLFIDPNPRSKQPGETELTSGVFLRNSLTPPVASFTVAQVNGAVQLNASTSSDPNGQTLSYQWSVDGTVTAGATTQEYQYTPGQFTSGSSHTFTLTVTDTSGLSKNTSQVVTIN